ncbi:MAG: ATP-binding protein, partial [Bacteroidetes bacterium]|nr:ATP-binding protein [Bacteroidota bacterium]
LFPLLVHLYNVPFVIENCGGQLNFINQNTPAGFHLPGFAPIFQRIKRRETDNVEGSGLGLAFVRKIVDLSGGTVWVESAGKEMGSTFYFTLPKQ